MLGNLDTQTLQEASDRWANHPKLTSSQQKMAGVLCRLLDELHNNTITLDNQTVSAIRLVACHLCQRVEYYATEGAECPFGLSLTPLRCHLSFDNDY